MRPMMKGWYFAAKDCRLRYGDDRIATVGVMHEIEGEPKCCERGLHASERALDALRLGAGPVVFRVTLSGMIDHGPDKAAAQRRTYDAGGVDCTNTLIEFACCAAMGAMLLAEHHDPRSWAAIEAALAWTRGEITEIELYAATNAAYAGADAADAGANGAYAAYAASAYAAYAEGAYVADAAYAAAYVAANAAAYFLAITELNVLLEEMLDAAIAGKEKP